ncbi:hypothetical protein LCGC14_0263360 [marine sediment metagenome]|uniref:NAD-dependent epimerase/dehydratase domain-containing protein n=1 Tax=marine sediment metagenome TaxID=412755 RepID=A0A0F9WLY8_9ZZZZ
MNKDILGNLAGKKCLVTGGTGLIGRQVVDILCRAGAKTRTVSLDKEGVDGRARHICADLTKFDLCMLMTEDRDYVFHLAGSKGSIKATKDKPADFFVPMLLLNTNMLEACRRNNVEKVVYTSSIGAYSQAEVFEENEGYNGQPMDFYPGWAKRIGEFQIKAYQTQYGMNNFSIVRLANVYGPGDNFNPDAMVIPALMARIHSGEDPLVVWGDGCAVRDFVYSRDVAEGIILALHHGTDSGFVNLGSGRGYSIRELIETLNSFIDFNYEFDPTKPSGFPKRVMDISLARKLLNYNPKTTLLDGLKKTWMSTLKK